MNTRVSSLKVRSAPKALSNSRGIAPIGLVSTFNSGKPALEAVALNVSGAAELVDAFEMACSLGPFDCFVLDVVRHDVDLAA